MPVDRSMHSPVAPEVSDQGTALNLVLLLRHDAVAAHLAKESEALNERCAVTG